MPLRAFGLNCTLKPGSEPAMSSSSIRSSTARIYANRTKQPRALPPQ